MNCSHTPNASVSSCCHTRKKWCCAVIALVIAAATCIAFALIMRDGLRDFQGEKRSVFVRGLAEREVTADLAAWPFALSATANDLTTAQAQLESQESMLRDFLAEQQLDVSALVLLRYDVQDLLAQQYRPQGIEQGRFVLTKVLLLRTDDVVKVEAASQAVDKLVKMGVALGSSSQPSYMFTGLNDIKPDMIKEATANAYEAAQQFAKDSGAQVGDIISASQGVFSIDGRDNIPAIGNMMPFTSDMQVNKNIRVVTSMTYKLD